MPSSTAAFVALRRILDAQLLFLHLSLGGSADLDDGYAARQLCQAFLELLAVVIGGGCFNLGGDLLYAGLDILGIAGRRQR